MSDNEETCIAGIQKLGALGKAAIEEAALVARLVEHSSWDIQFAAVRALPQIVGPEAAAKKFDSIIRNASKKQGCGGALVGLETCGSFGLSTVGWALKSSEDGTRYHALITASIIDEEGIFRSEIFEMLASNPTEKILKQVRRYILHDWIRRFFEVHSRWPKDFIDADTYIRKTNPLITLAQLTDPQRTWFEPEPDGSLKVRFHSPQPGGGFRTDTYYVIKKPEKSSPSPQAVLPWTSADGKTILAEFVRLDSKSVVIRKDGKEFSIPLAKLSPAIRKQAAECAPAKESTDKVQNKAATQNTPNLDYGLLIHYGMQTFTGPATGGAQSEKAAASRFAPANVDVKSWTKLAKEGGMTFAVMNVKHSSGFRLWDAPFDDYDMGSSPFKRDLLAEFIESCNAEGLIPGANYIITDVHREGAYRSKEPVPATHMKLIKQELSDLLTHYPGLRVLVFGHFGRFTPQEAAEIQTLVQTCNPKCVILDDGASGRTYRSLSTVQGWFLASPEAKNPKAADLFGDIQKWVNEGKPVLLNVGPARDGRIPQVQRDLVLKMKGFGSGVLAPHSR